MKNTGLSKKQILLVSLTALLFILFAVGADMIIKAQRSGHASALAAASASVASSSEAVYSGINSKLTDSIEDEPYEPGPSVLNLAYYYPDGEGTDDVINSYAGHIFTHMSELEAQYLAGFYGLYDARPLSVAQDLGYGASRVMGGYDPTDAAHNASDPSSWTVNHFKNINISFYDGDGNRINQYSAVKEIIAMASVSSYYHDMMGAEAMEEHAELLWELAHESSITLGNVYYCSGCLNRTVEDEASEALAQEQAQKELWDALAEATARSAGDAALSVLGMSGDGQSADVTSSEGADASQAQTAESTDTVLPSQSVQVTTEAAASTVQESGTEQGLSVINDLASQIASGMSASTEAAPAESTEAAQTEAATEATQVQETTATDTLSEYIVIGDQVFRRSSGLGFDDPVSYTDPTEAADTSILPGDDVSAASDVTTASPSEIPAETQTAATTVAQTTTAPAQTTAATQAPVAQTKPTASQPTYHQESTCPGHIDVYVTITIKGIDDINGLIEADTIGNDPANFNDEWQGWTEERIEEARELNAQDWFSRYGLTISAINIAQPLTMDEINYYLSLVTEGTSQQRLEILEYALNSVGKVPYYWGGKPYGAGYERNSFGTVTWPDEKGRVLRGLDCSGWINWVYWSVTGSSLPGESTGTLVGCGRRISRSQLRPGDIIIRTGADAHVVMFLSWTQNGNMLVVHETGGVTNNVVVSEMTADWPYYRTLIYD